MATAAGQGLRVLITGTSRGIGLGLTQAFLAHPDVSTVLSTCRSPESATDLQTLKRAQPSKLTILQLDVTDAKSQAALSSQLSSLGIGEIDILINNHGVSNPDHPVDPILTAKVEDLLSCFETNCLGTLLTLQGQSTRLIASKTKLCVILSSRLASIEQCTGTGGGYTSYRTSKAAVNMLGITYVNDPAIKSAGVRMLLLHPGWVQTQMGGSGGRVAPVTVERSCAGLVEQIMRGVAVQTSDEAAYQEGSFEDILNKERIVFGAFDGELLPF